MSYVGVGWRAVATIIDLVIVYILGYLVALVLGGTTASGFELQGAPALIWMLLSLLYYVGLEATLGATLGKLVLGLRVVTTDGAPITWSTALVRNLLRIVDGLFFYLVGAILVWRSPLRQRLGDRVAGTIVVRRGAQLARV
jgi:uncharacterized RDD family membrane protein YckC